MYAPLAMQNQSMQITSTSPSAKCYPWHMPQETVGLTTEGDGMGLTEPVQAMAVLNWNIGKRQHDRQTARYAAGLSA